VADVRHVPGPGWYVRVHATAESAGETVLDADNDADGVVSGLGDLGGDFLALLQRSYQVELAPQDAEPRTVAGRRTEVVDARRAGGTLAARFWLDQQTSLPLRREVFDEHGRTVRTSAYVDFVLDDAGRPALAGEAAAAPAAWGRRLSVADRERLRRAAWALPETLPGGLVLYEARSGSDGKGRNPVIHLGYSDGLSTVSVFEERGRLPRHGPAGFRTARVGGHAVHVSQSLPSQLVWAGDDRVFTLIADAPDGTVASVVASLPHGESARGWVDRLDRGVARVGSWINPFD
jgi:negative regulator of sigma E activity